jgi:preprotein translocase SecF subunit
MSFALITVITLFHDVFISSGLYIMTSNFLPEFKIDTYFITALLTTLGYSINDTIVVLDRIRTNLRAFGGRTKKLDEIVNMSVSETLTRSIYTSLTVIFVLVAILILGPVTIK